MVSKLQNAAYRPTGRLRISTLPFAQVGAWLLFLAIAAGDLPALWQTWATDPRLSFAPLVVLVAILLAWRVPGGWVTGADGGIVGLSLVAIFGGLHVVAVWGDIACLKPLSLLGLASGLLACIGGKQRLVQAGGILGWLLFLIPWPTTLTASLQFWMQLVSCRWATLFCGMAGIGVRCEGVQLFLTPRGPGLPIQRVVIAQPCSGLIAMLALLAVGYLLALLTPARLWTRSLLLLSAVPCALLANSARITLIVCATATRNPALAQWLHVHEQPVLVLLCSIALLCLRALLTGPQPPTPSTQKRISKAKQEYATRRKGSLLNSDSIAQAVRGGNVSGWARYLHRVCFSINSQLSTLNYLANILLLIALITGGLGARLEQAPLPVGDFLRDLPLAFPGWKSLPVALAASDVAALQPDSLLMRQWQNARGEMVELTVIAGHRKRTLHTPAYCLRGEGWEALEESSVALAIPSPSLPTETVSATNIAMLRNGQRISVTYFFSDGKEHTPNLARFQSLQLWQRLRGNTDNSALAILARIVVAVPEGDTKREQTLTADFARKTMPAVLESLRRAKQAQSIR